MVIPPISVHTRFDAEHDDVVARSGELEASGECLCEIIDKLASLMGFPVERLLEAEKVNWLKGDYLDCRRVCTKLGFRKG